MKFVKASAAIPKGFKANGISCGIKKSGKKDLALIYSDSIAVAAGMFTTNKIQAAPVSVSKNHIKDNYAQAIIINSGNANCMTGKNGLGAAKLMAKITAKQLKIKIKDVLIASTGIIGKPFPISKIKNGIPILVKKLNKKGIDNASLAIMTTDKKPKKIAVKININGKTVKICGIAKGAGMIYPKLAPHATMLSFIMTDAAITPNALKRALNSAVNNSFNCITVDGCRSTNDMVLILANGQAENKKIDINEEAFEVFFNALSYVCIELAKKIVKDAEGSTKFIQIKVKRAKDIDEAKKVAFAVANSVLLKTAIFGGSKNLGRIFSAIGQTGLDINEDKVRISTNSFKEKKIKILIYLNMGKAEATVYTSDLSMEYVRINARYN